jgi:hypothetical protein
MQMRQWSKRVAALPALGLLVMLPYSSATAQTTYNVTVVGQTWLIGIVR